MSQTIGQTSETATYFANEILPTITTEHSTNANPILTTANNSPTIFTNNLLQTSKSIQIIDQTTVETTTNSNNKFPPKITNDNFPPTISNTTTPTANILKILTNTATNNPWRFFNTANIPNTQLALEPEQQLPGNSAINSTNSNLSPATNPIDSSTKLTNQSLPITYRDQAITRYTLEILTNTNHNSPSTITNEPPPTSNFLATTTTTKPTPAITQLLPIPNIQEIGNTQWKPPSTSTTTPQQQLPMPNN
jgi:hypothetical protein